MLAFDFGVGSLLMNSSQVAGQRATLGSGARTEPGNSSFVFAAVEFAVTAGAARRNYQPPLDPQIKWKYRNLLAIK